MTGQKVAEPPKSRRPGGEHLRAAGRLVVRHLRGDPGPEQVRDLREHQRARRGLRRRRVDLDAVAADELAERRAVDEPGARPEPGRRALFATVNSPCFWPSSFARYCTPISAASGRPASRHLPILRSTWPCFSTFQKKLLAERNIRLPPRSRNRCTTSYSCAVTYSVCPSKTTKSYARASASPFAIWSKSESEMNSAVLPDQNSQCRNGRSYR